MYQCLLHFAIQRAYTSVILFSCPLTSAWLWRWRVLCLVRPFPTTNKKPQSNALWEQIYQTVATVFKILFSCPITLFLPPSGVTCGWCPDHFLACLAVQVLNYIASHTWMTCVLLRYVSQHSSHRRLAHLSCTKRVVGRWCIAPCQQKVYQFWLSDWSKDLQIWQNTQSQN